MTYVIEKNIPMPARATQVNARYPFAQMCVGDSFAVNVDPTTTKTFLRVHGRLSNAVSFFCKGSYRGRFTVRILRAEGVVRVWRTGM
jgi:hypothetical protein